MRVTTGLLYMNAVAIRYSPIARVGQPRAVRRRLEPRLAVATPLIAYAVDGPRVVEVKSALLRGRVAAFDVARYGYDLIDLE